MNQNWLIGGAIAMSVIATIQIGLLLWTLRRLGKLGHVGARVTRLADGLALLTDTTEAGLSKLIREVEQLGQRHTLPEASSRVSVTRRVAAAARNGQQLARIAEQESLSEGEVRLHLSLADADTLNGLRDAALHS